MNLQLSSFKPNGSSSMASRGGQQQVQHMSRTQQQPTTTASDLRQRLAIGPSSTAAMTTGAGAALDQLKRTADRLVEEQESTRHNIELYRDKLQTAQTTVSRLESELTRERQDNIQLRAKVKDGESQVAYVFEKMKLVASMHDDLRHGMQAVSCDIVRIDQYRDDLDQRTKIQQNSISEVERELEAAVHARDTLSQKLLEAEHTLADTRTQLEHALRHLADKEEVFAKAVNEMAVREQGASAQVVALQSSVSDFQVQLAGSRQQAEHLRAALKEQKSTSEQAAAAQAACLANAELKCAEFDASLKAVLGEQQGDKAMIKRLDKEMQDLGTENKRIRAELQDSQRELEERAVELQDALAQVEQLHKRVAELEAETETKEDALQRSIAACQQASQQVTSLMAVEAELRTALAVKEEELLAANHDKEELQASMQAKEVELQEALSSATAASSADAAKANALLAAKDQALRELQESADLKYRRFAERVDKEMAELRRKAKADADEQVKKVGEDLKAAVSAKDVFLAKTAEQEQALAKAAADLQELRQTKDSAVDELTAQMEAVRLQAQESLASLKAQMEAEQAKLKEEWERRAQAGKEEVAAAAAAAAAQAQVALRTELEAAGQEAVRAAEARLNECIEDLQAKDLDRTLQAQELEARLASEAQALLDARDREALLEAQLAEEQAKHSLAVAEVEKKDLLLKQISERINLVTTAPATEDDHDAPPPRSMSQKPAPTMGAPSLARSKQQVTATKPEAPTQPKSKTAANGRGTDTLAAGLLGSQAPPAPLELLTQSGKPNAMANEPSKAASKVRKVPEPPRFNEAVKATTTADDSVKVKPAAPPRGWADLISEDTMGQASQEPSVMQQAAAFKRRKVQAGPGPSAGGNLAKGASGVGAGAQQAAPRFSLFSGMSAQSMGATDNGPEVTSSVFGRGRKSGGAEVQSKKEPAARPKTLSKQEAAKQRATEVAAKSAAMDIFGSGSLNPYQFSNA